ncbi:MAG TPA: dTDP-4-dehydrorhamnose reductase [Polyangiaceae bacterium]|jgi:dTDP-4-dehydrorhamnose reductase
MTVWVTGAAGMLGSSVCGRLGALQVEFIGTGRELDIAHRPSVLDFTARHRPTHIINCAAYTKVDDAESHADAAYHANALGPEILAQAALGAGAALVHFSSDYVFDGAGKAPYVESARCGPLSVYGKTKLEGEEQVFRNMGSPDSHRFHLIRTSWLFGPNGKNFVSTILNLMTERETVSVVDDQWGRPSYTVDVAQAAMELSGLTGERSAPSGLYHFANAGETTWHGLALTVRELALELGWSLRTHTVEPVDTAHFPRPARRPAYSVLSTRLAESVLGHPPRAHREAVLDYLRSLRHAAG